MSASSDQDFQDLKRLLALKRHEQPPPGYFNTFSQEVVSSIQAGAQGCGAGEGEANIALWIYSLLEKLQVRPSWATAFGAIVCVGAIGAMIYLDQPAAQNLPESPLLTGVQSSSVVQPMHSGEALQPMTAGFAVPDVPEMNATSAPSLFDIEPAAFGFETETAGYR